MKTLAALLILLGIPVFVFAQPDEKAQIEAMKKLDWLVGEWTGTAWTQMGPNHRDTVDMHETGKFSRDGENWFPFFEMLLDKK